MKVSKHIHALRIPFQIPIAPGKLVDRDVYAFLVFGEEITLIDSGVSGAHLPIFDYIRENGRDPQDVSLLILSHAHPDHIGAAKVIREATDGIIAAHAEEKPWIEDTERQFDERPVPGFHALVGGPVAVDRLLNHGETLYLDRDISCRVIHTPGHSKGSISLLFDSEKALFTGDAVPIPGDLPIYESIADAAASLRRLKKCRNIDFLLSSWEAPIAGHDNVVKRLDEGIAYLRKIHEEVLKAKRDGAKNIMDLTRQVVAELGLPPFAAMPLVARAFASSIDAEAYDDPFDS